MLTETKEAGYRIRLAYLWLPHVRISLQRVRQRHLKGGHNVPSRDVRRRFMPSLVNFFRRYLPLADEALLFDAAAYPPQLNRLQVLPCGILFRVVPVLRECRLAEQRAFTGTASRLVRHDHDQSTMTTVQVNRLRQPHRTVFIDLGELSDNPYDPDSVSNPFGRYGSPYSSTSIKNPFSTYGSPFSSQSPNNPYATQAPLLFGD